MTTPNFRTRRAFLQTAAIASAGLVLPSFLSNTASRVLGQNATGSQPRRQPIPGFRDDHVLVVVQLGGGNDGLNTVAPYGFDEYRRARPTLALREGQVHSLARESGNDAGAGLGLHERMTAMKALYDNGKLAVINGVGYPNPNRSHFRSMEIWHTASDADTYADTGWIGRYFDNHCNGEAKPAAGVAIGGESPQAFGGEKGMGIAFGQPEQFRWQPGHGHDTEAAFRALNRLNAASPDGESTIDFLRHVSANIVLASDGVQDAAGVRRPNAEYPQSRLANSLRQVATLINGQLGTRIYYVNHGGFDTHANQAGQHANLLGQFSDAVAAFQADLAQMGQSRRVTILAFSEFGRRVTQNGSGGTDHGTAGPVFLIGDNVNAGVHGTYPSLANLDNNDLRFTTDFRSVYASILRQWFDINPNQVLGRDFPTLPLIRG